MPSDNVDKCGIKGIVTWTPEGFKSACYEHDRAYILNETNEQPLSRKEVDRQLLVRLLAISNTPLKKIAAYTYYGIARLAGYWFW